MIQLHIDKLSEGVYLATSDDVQGLIAQEGTLKETVEIARDVARKLIESQTNFADDSLPPLRESFDYPPPVAVKWGDVSAEDVASGAIFGIPVVCP